jgi:uncharacterized protein (DUF608 family)
MAVESMDEDKTVNSPMSVIILRIWPENVLYVAAFLILRGIVE